MIRETSLLLLLAVAVPGFGQATKADPVANPAGPGSLQPNWSTTKDGNPLLSWIEKAKDGSYSLKYAIHSASGWSEARTVAAHRRFFRHPAEAPGMISLSDGTLLAHWVENPSEDSEAEFLHVSASHDGVKWSTPVMAHKDRSQVQHGLASMVASGDREASLIWLEALKGEDAPVTMKRTVINAEGSVVKEESLDPDVCGCCPTAIVKTARGLLIAYRDHTPEDIRDISTIRFENGKWTASKNLNPDKWQINSCPTNAAAVDAKGDRIAVAWFTGAQEKPRAQIAFSSDGGSTFGKPTVVSTGTAYGYVATAIDDGGGTYVSWLEQGGGGARVLVRSIASNGTAGPVLQVAQGSRQSLGYPRLSHKGSETWIAWGGAKVQTARLIK